jgi:hypothetical protein
MLTPRWFLNQKHYKTRRGNLHNKVSTVERRHDSRHSSATAPTGDRTAPVRTPLRKSGQGPPCPQGSADKDSLVPFWAVPAAKRVGGVVGWRAATGGDDRARSRRTVAPRARSWRRYLCPDETAGTAMDRQPSLSIISRQPMRYGRVQNVTVEQST